MQLYYAVKPLGINQKFGQNPAYYARFGWKGHNGIDFFAPHATPLYAPCDGVAFYVQDTHGGDGIYIRTPDNENPQYNIILWHLIGFDDPVHHPTIPKTGTILVKCGALIGYTDNSGAPYESSGDHLHFGVMPCDKTGEALNPNNGYGGCIDPLPFFTGLFAQDIEEIDASLQSSEKIVQAITQAPLSNTQKISLLDSLKKVVEFFATIFK